MMNSFCKSTFFAIVLITFAGLLIYANSLTSPFMFDDLDSIVANEIIESPANFFTNSKGYYFLPNRYISYLSFALNYHFDGHNVVGYHVVNLAIHLLNAALVYVLLRLMFQTPFLTSCRKPQVTHAVAQSSFLNRILTLSLPTQELLPLLAALLFVVHPVQTQAVTYIVQRSTSLTMLWYLLSLWFYLKARLIADPVSTGEHDTRNQVEQPTRQSIVFLASSFLMAVLAMKTKEIAFTLPIAALLFEVMFLSGRWTKRCLYWLPLSVTLLIIPLTLFVHETEFSPDTELDIDQKFRVDTSISRTDYLFTQFRVIMTYLRLLVFPVQQNLDYDYRIFSQFLSTPIVLSFVLLAVLFVSAIHLFFYTQKGRDQSVRDSDDHDGAEVITHQSHDPLVSILELRLISFGILWFFLTLSVESSFVPIVDVIMEHRLYLPSFGAAIVFAAIFSLVQRHLAGRAQMIFSCCLILIVLTLGYATWHRNQVWSDPVRMWSDVVAKSPDKARPYNNLGFSFIEAGRLSEAVDVLSRSIELAPRHPHAYHNMGRALILSGQSQSSIPYLKKAISLKPDFLDAYISLAAAYNQAGQPLNTIALLEPNLSWVNTRFEPYYNLAMAYAMTGQRNAFRKAQAMVARFDPVRAKELNRFVLMKVQE